VRPPGDHRLSFAQAGLLAFGVFATAVGTTPRRCSFNRAQPVSSPGSDPDWVSASGFSTHTPERKERTLSRSVPNLGGIKVAKKAKTV
jgi:hypothetical protein